MSRPNGVDLLALLGSSLEPAAGAAIASPAVIFEVALWIMHSWPGVTRVSVDVDRSPGSDVGGPRISVHHEVRHSRGDIAEMLTRFGARDVLDVRSGSSAWVVGSFRFDVGMFRILVFVDPRTAP